MLNPNKQNLRLLEAKETRELKCEKKKTSTKEISNYFDDQLNGTNSW